MTKELDLHKKYKSIFIMEVLEHLPNPLYLMSQVYNLLDDGGRCYIGLPYTELDPQRRQGLNSHINRWRDYEIYDDLKKLGFKVKFILKRRRFKNVAFWLPHCFLVLEIKKPGS